jgi:ABC-2 type transport system permease protein
MKTLRDFSLLFKREFIHALRMPIWLFVGISTPLLYLALYTPLLQKLAGGPGFPTTNVLDVFLPGMLAYLAFMSGSTEGYGTIFSLKDGQVERLRVTPASRVALLLSPILSDIVWMFIFIAILVAVAVPFGFHAHIAGLLVSLVLLALLVIVTGAFSVTIALMTKEISTFASIVSGISLPVLLLSGVLLPLSMAPTWMRVIAHFNPLFYVVDANRLLAANNIWNSTVGLAFLVTGGLVIVTLLWATRIYKKAVA